VSGTMNIEWAMAVGVGVCNSGVALAAKGAERARCRVVPYCLVAFAVAGLAAFVASLGGAVNWADWRLWAFGSAMGALFLAAMAVMLHANCCWPPSIVWSAANMAFVLPILASAAVLGEPLRWMDAAIVGGVALMLAGLTDQRVKGGTAATGRLARFRMEALAAAGPRVRRQRRADARIQTVRDAVARPVSGVPRGCNVRIRICDGGGCPRLPPDVGGQPRRSVLGISGGLGHWPFGHGDAQRDEPAGGRRLSRHPGNVPIRGSTRLRPGVS